MKRLFVAGKFGQVSGPHNGRIYPRGLIAREIAREIERITARSTIEKSRIEGQLLLLKSFNGVRRELDKEPFAHRLAVVLKHHPRLIARATDEPSIYNNQPDEARVDVLRRVLRTRNPSVRSASARRILAMFDKYVDEFLRMDDLVAILGALT